MTIGLFCTTKKPIIRVEPFFLPLPGKPGDVHLAVKYIFILLTGLFCQEVLFAQKTVITGSAPGAERKMIRVSTPGDFITFLEKPLATARIDSTGRFSVIVTIDKTTFVSVAIDFHKTELVIEPAQKYELQFDPMKYDESTDVNPIILSQNLTFTFAHSDSLGLNDLIGNFDSVYSDFLMKNFNALYRNRNKVLLDTFRVQLNEKFGAVQNPYFINYATYKLASLEQLARYYGQSQLIKKYFSDQPVLYDNPEYMDLFNSVFSKYLTVTSNIFRKIDFNPVLKSPDPYSAVMKLMAGDTLLINTRLRELVMLKGMMELYNLSNYDPEKILSVITTAKEKSPFPENRVVAENIISLLTKLKPGAMAPEFTLLNRDQKEISLKEFRGKPVVLGFWTTYCEECLSEMELIKPLYDKYKNDIQFVSVSADKYFSKMLFFINLKKDYVWTFVNIGDHSEVLIDYEVRTYPLFVLIDKDGKINKYQAKQPSSGLEADLQKMLKE